MENTVSSNIEGLIKSIKNSYKALNIKNEKNNILSNEQIESVLGLKCFNENPKTIEDIFSGLQFNSTVMELFKWIHTTESYKKTIPVEIEHIPPSQGTINSFISSILDDVKLQMLDDSINYFSEFFKKEYSEYAEQDKIRSVREELFFSDETQLLKAFYDTMDENILDEDFPKQSMKDCFESPNRRDLLRNIPKATFLWTCYVMNRLRNDMFNSESPCKALKSELKFKSLAKFETPIEYQANMTLSKEYGDFRYFMLKLDIQNEEIPLNKSLNLQLFNRNTSLFDIYLYSKFIEDKPETAVKSKNKSQGSEWTKGSKFISNTDNRPRVMIDRELQRNEIKKFSLMSSIDCNNIKYHLLTADIEDIQDTIYKSPSFLLLIKHFVVPFIQQYIENLVVDKKLYEDKYQFNNEELSKHLLIYNELKAFEPSIPVIKAVCKELPEYDEIDKIAYFYSYKNTIKLKKKSEK